MKYFARAALCFVVAYSGATAFRQPKREFVTQLKECAQVGWESWIKDCEQIEARIKEEMHADGTVKDAVDYHFFLNRDLRRRHLFRKLADGRLFEEGWVRRSDEYFFCAEHFDNSEWLIIDFEKSPRSPSDVDLPYFFIAPYEVHHSQLSTLLNDKQFNINAITELREDGENLIKIDFTYGRQGNTEVRLDGPGWIVLAPSSNCAIRRYRIRNSQGYIIARTVKYGKVVDGFRPIREFTDEYLGKDGTLKGA